MGDKSGVGTHTGDVPSGPAKGDQHGDGTVTIPANPIPSNLPGGNPPGHPSGPPPRK